MNPTTSHVPISQSSLRQNNKVTSSQERIQSMSKQFQQESVASTSKRFDIPTLTRSNASTGLPLLRAMLSTPTQATSSSGSASTSRCGNFKVPTALNRKTDQLKRPSFNVDDLLKCSEKKKFKDVDTQYETTSTSDNKETQTFSSTSCREVFDEVLHEAGQEKYKNCRVYLKKLKNKK